MHKHDRAAIDFETVPASIDRPKFTRKTCPGHHFIYTADRSRRYCLHCWTPKPGRKRRRPPQERKR